MNKYYDIIRNLTIEQKLKLIISEKYIENNQIEDYIVPKFNIEFDFKDILEDFINPSFNSIGSTYDPKLIEDFSYEIGKYLSHIRMNKIINIPCNPVQDDKSSFSSSRLVTARMAASMAKGIEKGGFLVSYGILPGLSSIDVNSYYNNELYSFKVALTLYKPFACILNTPNALDALTLDYDYDGFKVVITNNQKELINSLNHSVELSIINGYLVDYKDLLDAIERYKFEKNRLVNEEITVNDFRNMLNKSEILNPEAIDIALSSLLRKLSIMENHFNQNVSFDSNKINELENIISKESVVLLKNDSKILPLKRENIFAFIGDSLFNPPLNTENKIEYDIEKIIDGYHLETKGIAHGYLNNESSSEDLLVKAERLADTAEYSIVFLNEKDGHIPDNEIVLLKRLELKNTKIIPVLFAKSFVDITPLKDYQAILMVFSDSKSCIESVLDVIVGKYNPTARLPFALKNDVNNLNFKDKEALIYPLCHGNSYSSFNYTSITIDEGGIVLAVTNESKISGTDTLFFTTQYLDGSLGEYNYIRDFITVNLEGHESKLVEFDYDFNSFAVYDIDKNQYLIRKGRYCIELMTAFDEVLAENEIYLEELTNDNITSSNLPEEYDSISESFDALNYDVKQPNNYIPKALKIVSLIVIDIYLLVLSIIFTIYSNTVAMIIIPFVITFIAIIISFFIILNSIMRKNDVDKVTNLTEMINSFGEYSVDVHESFKEPVPVIEDEEEEIIEEIVEEVKEDEPQKQFIYDAFGEQIIDDLEYTNYDTFEEMVDRFTKFALTEGVMIEAIYAKQLLASILSTNMVIITGKTKEKNVETIKLLSKFFGSDEIFMDISNKEKIDMYWDIGDDNQNYRLSIFANNILRISNLPKRFNIISFDGVTDDNLFLIDEFINFSSTPLEKHQINIGENHKISIPSNTVIVLFMNQKLSDERIYKDSLSLDLVTNNNNVESESINLKYNDYQYLKTMIDQARNKNYVSEDIWRKLDIIFDNQLFNDFKLNNKDVLVIEKLIAILIDMKFDEIQSLNYVFIMRIIPLLLIVERNSSPSFRQQAIEIFDKALEDKIEVAIKAYRNS